MLDLIKKLLIGAFLIATVIAIATLIITLIPAFVAIGMGALVLGASGLVVMLFIVFLSSLFKSKGQ